MEIFNHFITDYTNHHTTICNYRQGIHCNTVDRVICNWLDDKLHGEYNAYFSDGMPSMMAHYSHGKKVKLYMLYSVAAPHKLIAITEYNCTSACIKKCNRCLTHKAYYSNGSITHHKVFVNGKLHGAYKQYLRDGSLRKSEQYANGKLHGECKYYNGDVMIRSEQYVKGKLHGFRKRYRSDGTLSEELNYWSGKLHGISTAYSRTGNIHRVKNYEHGVLI